MSFEETLVCDGCSRVIDGGGRAQMMRGLREDGGRAFRVQAELRGGSKVLVEHDWEDGMGAATQRHLCARCVSKSALFDGMVIPAPRATPEAGQ